MVNIEQVITVLVMVMQELNILFICILHTHLLDFCHMNVWILIFTSSPLFKFIGTLNLGVAAFIIKLSLLLLCKPLVWPRVLLYSFFWLKVFPSTSKYY